MISKITKSHLLLAFLGMLTFFNQPSVKGQTNESDVIWPTNNFAWFMESFQEGIGTNGLSFSLSMNNRNLRGYPSQNYCGVYVSNQSTNRFYLWFLYQAIWLKVELLDSNGQSVEKTEIGKQFGKPINITQLYQMIEERRHKWATGWARTPGFTPLVTSMGSYPFTGFNVSELFDIKQTGEYTLKVQMPLIQTDQSGEVEVHPDLKIIWLPEVVAKVEIRPEDIPPPNLPSNAQTNSLIK